MRFKGKTAVLFSLLLLIGLVSMTQCVDDRSGPGPDPGPIRMNETRLVVWPETSQNATQIASQVIYNRTNSSGVYQMNLSDDGHVLTYHHEENSTRGEEDVSYRSESLVIEQNEAIDSEDADRLRADAQERLTDMQRRLRGSILFPSVLGLARKNVRGEKEDAVHEKSIKQEKTLERSK